MHSGSALLRGQTEGKLSVVSDEDFGMYLQGTVEKTVDIVS